MVVTLVNVRGGIVESNGAGYIARYVVERSESRFPEEMLWYGGVYLRKRCLRSRALVSVGV